MIHYFKKVEVFGTQPLLCCVNYNSLQGKPTYSKSPREDFDEASQNVRCKLTRICLSE